MVFCTDDKAENGKAWIGVFLGAKPWFSVEVEKVWALWAFTKGDTKKVIAALELVATLVGVRLWVPEGQAKQTSRVAIKGYTDNQSNESLLKKFVTSKFPSTFILVELAEELTAKRCEHKLQWLRRDDNQLADDLTHEKFDAFDMDGRGRELPSRAKARKGDKRAKPARFHALGKAKKRRLAPWQSCRLV